MLLVAAMCAVLFHGAFSSPSPSSNFHDEDLMLRSDNADEESDQNPILIYLAKKFIKVSTRIFYVNSFQYFIEYRGGPNVNTTSKYLIKICCCLFHLACILYNVSSYNKRSYITTHWILCRKSDAKLPWNTLRKSAESHSPQQ